MRYVVTPGLSMYRTLDQTPDPSEFPLHSHLSMEFFCFLQGDAVFHIEGSEYPLEPGDILLIRPGETHYIELKPGAPYERITIHFSVELLTGIDPDCRILNAYTNRLPGSYNLYHQRDLNDPALLDRLIQLKRRDASRLTVIAHLIHLLTDINRCFSTYPAAQELPLSLEHRIMQYISSNLASPLTTEQLCAQFFISPSQLFRRFKKSTGTSVGKYVTAKRMAYARYLIQSGEKPTRIYSQCGYRDYTTFYRAYIRYFGHNPKEAGLYLMPAESEAL